MPLLRLQGRFGRPQIYALLLLFVMMAEAMFLAAHMPLSTSELSYVHGGAGDVGVLESAEGTPAVSAHVDSPIVARVARLTSFAGIPAEPDSPFWRILLRLPFILVGSLLGASVWYVSRRLYGNAAGYVALALFVFSPAVVIRASTIAPDVIAAWGTFGCVFTGIAVAHTLYAPREVVLWNWRRILLLGISIGLAMAASVGTVVALPLALMFMLYLVPHRRGAALLILLASCAVGAGVWLFSFGFDLTRARYFVRAGAFSTNAGFLTGSVVSALGSFVMSNGPAFAALLALAFVSYVVWRRVRFFGVTAPLLTFVLLVTVAVTAGSRNVMVLLSTAMPFMCVFIAGVAADLLELRTRWSPLIQAGLLAAVVSHALISITGLVRLGW